MLSLAADVHVCYDFSVFTTKSFNADEKASERAQEGEREKERGFLVKALKNIATEKKAFMDFS